MKLQTHGNRNGLDDLHVLPETISEHQKIVAFLRDKKQRFHVVISDVKGQDWYGKQFIDVPFGEELLTELQEYMVKQ